MEASSGQFSSNLPDEIKMDAICDEYPTDFKFNLDIAKTYLVKDENGTALPKTSTSNEAHSDGDSPNFKQIRIDPRLKRDVRKRIFKTSPEESSYKKMKSLESISDTTRPRDMPVLCSEEKITLAEYKKRVIPGKHVEIKLSNPMEEWHVLEENDSKPLCKKEKIKVEVDVHEKEMKNVQKVRFAQKDYIIWETVEATEAATVELGTVHIAEEEAKERCHIMASPKIKNDSIVKKMRIENGLIKKNPNFQNNYNIPVEKSIIPTTASSYTYQPLYANANSSAYHHYINSSNYVKRINEPQININWYQYCIDKYEEENMKLLWIFYHYINLGIKSRQAYVNFEAMVKMANPTLNFRCFRLFSYEIVKYCLNTNPKISADFLFKKLNYFFRNDIFNAYFVMEAMILTLGLKKFIRNTFLADVARYCLVAAFKIRAKQNRQMKPEQIDMISKQINWYWVLWWQSANVMMRKDATTCYVNASCQTESIPWVSINPNVNENLRCSTPQLPDHMKIRLSKQPEKEAKVIEDDDVIVLDDTEEVEHKEAVLEFEERSSSNQLNEIIDLTWIDEVEEVKDGEGNEVLPGAVSPGDSGIDSPKINKDEQVKREMDNCKTQLLCICGKTANCSCLCSLVVYCSTVCQHVDWPRHKQECKGRIGV